VTGAIAGGDTARIGIDPRRIPPPSAPAGATLSGRMP